jgi:transposase
MLDPEPVLKARLVWVQMYERTQNAALTCRRCGISKATLRKWWLRYQQHGEVGLQSQSRRPHHLRPRQVTPEQETLILDLRRTRKLGPKGLQRELLRLHQLSFSTRTIWKVLKAHGVSVLRPRRRPRQPKRYSCAVPGQRIQIDTCKIGRDLIQFTAVDDCTRLRVLGLYSSRTAQDAVHFLRHRLLTEFPFPIQRIQSDRGSEFVGYDFQEALQEQHIKFRPNRPRAPHLNGKVEPCP